MSVIGTETRSFSIDDQSWFARVSGDANPIHIDPVQARRLLYGEVVVHGAHLLLWAIDLAIRNLPAGPHSLVELKAVFSQPVRLGETVTLTAKHVGEGRAKIHATVAGTTVARGTVAFRAGRSPAAAVARTAPAQDCRALDYDAIRDARGELALYVDKDEVLTRYAHVDALAPAQVAELLAVTRLVGMECPGDRSLFAAVSLAGEERGAHARACLEYGVERADDRHGLIALAVRGPTLRGRVEALHRPAPVQQPAMELIARSVVPGEFADREALVVGGSRGLGEVAAKLLAAGGARVTISYRLGVRDAERVVDEIARFGGTCRAIQLDVLDPGPLQGLRPTHLYYFASPRIARRTSRAFSMPEFIRYAQYYVAGLHAVVQRARASCDELFVLYPSTMYIDEPARGLGEYAAAKAAGEQICRQLQAAGAIRARCVRFPRVSTDQTAEIGSGHEASLEATPVVLKALRD